VNLPVRTVIIYDQTYQGQPDDARLRGARLVNAMGRAGRSQLNMSHYQLDGHEAD